MKPNNDDGTRRALRWSEIAGDSIIVVLAMFFVGLYAAASVGKLDPLRDSTMLMRLEPIIFVLLGYCFARSSSRHVERALSAEIARQTNRADAAQFAKERANEEREVIEEKMRNARIALVSEQNRAAAIRIIES